MGKVYHSNTKIRFVLGLMNKNEIGGIPSSTWDYWKRYFNLGKVIGIQDQDMDVELVRYFYKRKYLIRIIYASMQVETVIHTILRMVPDRNKLLFQITFQNAFWVGRYLR